MSTKSTESHALPSQTQVETAPKIPLQQAVASVLADSQKVPQLFLRESEAPHGGE